MPTYEYECQKCNHKLEAFQAITAKPLRKCPSCSGKLKRLISGGAGFIFKGSGFYITDYRSKSYQKDKKADQPKKDDKSKKSDQSNSASSSPATSKGNKP